MKARLDVLKKRVRRAFCACGCNVCHRGIHCYGSLCSG